MINKNFINKIILLVVISLTFGSTISTLMIGTVKAEDDWIKITSPANGDELCVGTKAMIRFDTNLYFTEIAIEVSKIDKPDFSNSSDWEELFHQPSSGTNQIDNVQKGLFEFEVKKEYLSQTKRTIRIRSTVKSVFDHAAIIISSKPVLNAVNWVDPNPLGNRKPLILVNGIELSFNFNDIIIPGLDVRVKNQIPEEKQWDNLLLYLYNKDNKVIIDNFKPYIFLYDSNDTDSTFPSEDGVSAVAKHLERRLIEMNLDSNLHFIAHSMGGLVCRQYFSGNADRVNRIITLFTPHHGSMLPNYPPTQLEINNNQGHSRFLKDISWDYDVSGLDDSIIEAKDVSNYMDYALQSPIYFNYGDNTFLTDLNKTNNNNYKVIPYYGENPNLSLGSPLDAVNWLILTPHWSKIFLGLEMWAKNHGIEVSKLKDFKRYDGVVQARSGMGYGLGFQQPRLIAGCDHIGWSNDDFNLKDLLFGQIAKDLSASLSQTPQPNPPSELLPAPTVKPAIKMDNGDIKLEWSELKGAGVYYVEVAQRKNYSSSVKTNDYSSPYQIWTIEVSVPKVAVPYAYFIDGVEYVWHVRAGSKSNVLGKYSPNGTFTYSKNSLDFGPPEIVNPGVSEVEVKVQSQDMNNVTLMWKLDTKFAGKVRYFNYEVSKKTSYWEYPYLVAKGVERPSNLRSDIVSLSPGDYYWRIRSTDSDGQTSSWSEIKKFSLIFLPKPVCSNPPPKNFKVDQSCSPKKISLSWDTPQEDGCNLTGYELSYSFDGKKYQNKSKEGDKQYTIPSPNVVEEKEYVFEICAIYGDKKSAAATTRTYFTCKECSKPPEKLSSPPLGKLDVANKSIVFTWDEPLMQSSCKIKHYMVSYRKNGVEDSSLGSSTVSEKSVTLQKGLSQGFEYQIGVKAVNDVGPASGDPVWSNKVKFEFNCDPTTPGKPMAQNISTLCTDGFMLFKWDASTVMGGCNPLLGYVVEAEYNKTPLNLVLNFTSSNTYKLPLDKAGLYRVKVVAGGEMSSQWSDEVRYDCSSVNCTPPPTNLKLVPTGNKMVMSWTKPAIAKTCSQVVKYKYRYYIEPDKASTVTKDTLNTSIESWQLQQGTATYCFQVKAIYSNDKESDWAPSNNKWENITFTYNPAPNPPSVNFQFDKVKLELVNNDGTLTQSAIPAKIKSKQMFRITFTSMKEGFFIKPEMRKNDPINGSVIPITSKFKAVRVLNYEWFGYTDDQNDGSMYIKLGEEDSFDQYVQGKYYLRLKVITGRTPNPDKASAAQWVYLVGTSLSSSPNINSPTVFCDDTSQPQPPPNCKPSTPVLNEPSVDCQNKKLTITWSKSTVQSGCPGITRYMVYVKTNNGDFDPRIAVREYDEFPVNIGDTILVKVKAIAENKTESEFSQPIIKIIDCGATPPPKTDCKPSKPGKPIGEQLNNSDLMKFTWTASSVLSGCKKIKTYIYQYNFNGDPPENIFDSKGESFAIVKPIIKNAKGRYCLWVKAITEDEVSSEWSELGCFEYNPPPAPPQPPDTCDNPRPPSSIKLSKDCDKKSLIVSWTDSPDKANCSNLKYKYVLYWNNTKRSNGNLMTSPESIEIFENGTYYLEIASVVGDKVGKYERSQDNIVFDCEKKVPSKKIELITENGRMYNKNIRPSDFKLSWKGVENWDNTDQNMKYVLKITNTSSPETVYEWHVSDGYSQVDWHPLVNKCTKPEGVLLSLEYNSYYTWSVSLIDKNHPNPYIESDKRSFYTTPDPNNTITAPHSVQLEDAANSSKITCGQVCHVGNNQFNLGEFFFNAIVDCSAPYPDQTEIWYQEGQDQMKYLATANITPGGRAIVPCSLRPGDYVLYARAIDNVDDSGNPYPPAKVRVSSFKNVFDGCDVHIRIIAQALNLGRDYEIQNQKSFPCIDNKYISNQLVSPSKDRGDCGTKIFQDDPFDLVLIKDELGDWKRSDDA